MSININKLRLNETGTQIEVSVTTSIDNTFISFRAWNIDTYKDQSKAINLYGLMDGDSNSEILTITNIDLSTEIISGVWFFEFQSDETIETGDFVNTNRVIGVVTNLSKYHECILDKLLSINIVDCNISTNNCNSDVNNLYLGNSLLCSLNAAISYAYYEEVVRIVKNLDEICIDCSDCPEYENTPIVSGARYGVEDNSIIFL